MEVSEAKRRLQDMEEEFVKKLEGEMAVRNLLQENNERLHGDLEMTRTNADIKTRKEVRKTVAHAYIKAEYEDFSKKLLKELEDQQKSFLDQIEALNKDINAEKLRRIEVIRMRNTNKVEIG